MGNNGQRLNIAQKRLEFAWKCAQKGQEKGKEYTSAVRKMPALLLNNGLNTTFAFVYSKGSKKEKTSKSQREKTKSKENHWDFISKNAQEWLSMEHSPVKSLFKGDEGLIKVLIDIEHDQQRYILRELLTLFAAIKRFIPENEE